MATMKKLRQRKTMEIKKTIGVSIEFARKIAREIVDRRYNLTIDSLISHPEIVNYEQITPSCGCCGTYYIFKTKKGSFTYRYGLFTF